MKIGTCTMYSSKKKKNNSDSIIPWIRFQRCANLLFRLCYFLKRTPTKQRHINTLASLTCRTKNRAKNKIFTIKS